MSAAHPANAPADFSEACIANSRLEGMAPASPVRLQQTPVCVAMAALRFDAGYARQAARCDCHETAMHAYHLRCSGGARRVLLFDRKTSSAGTAIRSGVAMPKISRRGFVQSLGAASLAPAALLTESPALATDPAAEADKPLYVYFNSD